MPGLTSHRTVVQLCQLVKEGQRFRGRERQAWRQLQQQTAQFSAQLTDRIQKGAERVSGVAQACVVTDGTWHLHGKAKRRWHGTGPSTVGGGPMRPMEGGVDLDAVKSLRIAFETAVALRKAICHCARD